jgi:hypothetical protein
MESVKILNGKLASSVQPKSGRMALYGAAFCFGLAIILELLTISEAVLSALHTSVTSLLTVNPLMLAGALMVAGGLFSVLFGVLQSKRKAQAEVGVEVLAVGMGMESGAQTADGPNHERKRDRELVGFLG